MWSVCNYRNIKESWKTFSRVRTNEECDKSHVWKGTNRVWIWRNRLWKADSWKKSPKNVVKMAWKRTDVPEKWQTWNRKNRINKQTKKSCENETTVKISNIRKVGVTWIVRRWHASRPWTMHGKIKPRKCPKHMKSVRLFIWTICGFIFPLPLMKVSSFQKSRSQSLCLSVCVCEFLREKLYLSLVTSRCLTPLGALLKITQLQKAKKSTMR